MKSELLKRLDNGEVIIGDGGMVFLMERRGYCTLGPATPEAVIEHPEAVRQAHREFLHAGSDLVQAFTFYATEDKLGNRGYDANKFGCEAINRAACRLAKEVTAENGLGAMAVASVSQTPSYLTTRNETHVKNEFRQQIKVFVEEKIDFLICEYFEHVEEIKWAIETGKEFGLDVGATMCIGPEGDLHGVPVKEIGKKLIEAGANVIGINCHFGPETAIKTMKLMIEGVREAGLKAHFMVQPLCYHTPDASKQGFIDLPEFPFALEPRVCTRIDIHKYAREAYNLGIRYIGGCCGFEPYHIRAISEELSAERNGKLGEASKKHMPWGAALKMHTKPWVRARTTREFWENLKPASGRPYSAPFSKSDDWGVTAGDSLLVQHQESTTADEMAQVLERANIK